MSPRYSLMPLVAGLVVAACSEPPSAPPTAGTPSMASAPVTSSTGRYILSFPSAIPGSLRSAVSAKGGVVDWSSPGAKIATISHISAATAAAVGRQVGAQVYADELVAMDAPVLDATPELATLSGVESPTNPAGAARYTRQWNMRQVEADAAWADGRLGSSSVTVAILDTGIDYLNLDLNGLVDGARSADLLGTFTVNGVSFTERDTVAKYFPTRAEYTDLFFHGTHVAATVSSNALAAAGVTSQTTLMAVKVCAYLNTCPFSSILNGVIYAADNGADVINMSLGGGLPKAGNGRFIGLITKTFNYANSKGVTIVVSAGNSAIDLDHDANNYSTFCNTTITVCVAATGPTAQSSVDGPWTNPDSAATYTNFGTSAINLAAPGGNHSTFVWAACSQTSLIIPVCQTGNFILGAQGTSMAAPHVSGTAALLVEDLGRNPGAIKGALQNTSDDINTQGADPYSGKGRVNTGHAVGAS